MSEMPGNRMFASKYYDLGMALAKEPRGKGEPGEALRWLLKSADLGFVPAQFRLGLIYFHGDDTGFKDYAQAFAWWQKAAQVDHIDAQYYLGLCYVRALGVDQSYPRGIYWLQKAAHQGHADAMYMLGQVFHLGKGVSRNYLKASYWYGKAADKGHVLAKAELMKTISLNDLRMTQPFGVEG